MLRLTAKQSTTDAGRDESPHQANRSGTDSQGDKTDPGTADRFHAVAYSKLLERELLRTSARIRSARDEGAPSHFAAGP